MNTITEPQLIDNAKNGTIVCIKAVPDRAAGKGYNIYVQLNWKEGDLLLITQKKIPRNWASADRLLAHMNKTYGVVSTITIFLRGNSNDESTRMPEQHP